MKFTHRVAGPKKGNNSLGLIKIRKPPKKLNQRPNVPKVEHLGSFAKLGDAIK